VKSSVSLQGDDIEREGLRHAFRRREHLKAFICRIGTHIHEENRAGVVADLHGYEAGAGGACTFTAEVSRHVYGKAGVKAMSTGWPGQIDIFAEQTSVTWVRAFRRLAWQLLVEADDDRVRQQDNSLI
jgi:hypothetical protein